LLGSVIFKNNLKNYKKKKKKKIVYSTVEMIDFNSATNVDSKNQFLTSWEMITKLKEFIIRLPFYF
jgi:hypothetical protein